MINVIGDACRTFLKLPPLYPGTFYGIFGGVNKFRTFLSGNKFSFRIGTLVATPTRSIFWYLYFMGYFSTSISPRNPVTHTCMSRQCYTITFDATYLEFLRDGGASHLVVATCDTKVE